MRVSLVAERPDATCVPTQRVRAVARSMTDSQEET
jgi:hypothetical protein